MHKPGAKTGGRRANYDLDVIERFEAGVELLGTEVRSVKEGRARLLGARVIVRGGEAFLLGAMIPAYQPANAPSGFDPERSRRLLLSKKEIGTIANLIETMGAVAVPSKTYIKGNRIKVEIVVGRRKKKFDKRENIKRKDDTRSVLREIKQSVKFK